MKIRTKTVMPVQAALASRAAEASAAVTKKQEWRTRITEPVRWYFVNTGATPKRNGNAKGPDVFSGYGQPDKPFASYGALAAVYASLFSGLLFVTHRRGAMPERIEARDIGLLALATFRLSRLVTKDKVMSSFRAPFTRFEEPAGAGEVEEDARGDGLQRAIGDLLTCPYCVGLWIATGLAFGLALAPRSTRLLASILATVAGSDALNHGYLMLKEKTQ
ncbi:MAG TPA: DUF1360 domain-containing protein [Chthoniobacterales bacterium]